MTIVNMHEAKSRLSQLVDAVQSGAEPEIVLAKNGVPAARIVPMPPKRNYRWGLAKGKWVIPDDIDALNPEIEKLFYGEDD
ncbi:MAG: type II toxin-antitoxin system prevent-host-death family antitoxin [Novosphingobium sp.]|nr:type II toxin-antitoxin system prevent-host-death family antitoxin [Novosphingobium sp.]